jgi:hypothetical protein
MSENDISILEWLKKFFTNPKRWLIRIPKGGSESFRKNGFQDTEVINQPETNDELQLTKSSESISSIDLVQVDISVIIPAGSSINLEVTTGVECNGPFGKVEASPQLEKIWFEVNPSSGAKIPKRGGKGNRAGNPLSIGNYKISISLVTVLVILSLLLYTFTRFAGLSRFPAYFFSDEAMQTIFAEKLIDNNFLAANNKNIPVYVTF